MSDSLEEHKLLKEKVDATEEKKLSTWIVGQTMWCQIFE